MKTKRADTRNGTPKGKEPKDKQPDTKTNTTKADDTDRGKKKDNSKKISFNQDRETYDRISKIADERGESVSTVLNEIISEQLNLQDQNDRLEQMDITLEEIKKQAERITGKKHDEYTSASFRLTYAEKRNLKKKSGERNMSMSDYLRLFFRSHGWDPDFTIESVEKKSKKVFGMLNTANDKKPKGKPKRKKTQKRAKPKEETKRKETRKRAKPKEETK